MKTTFLFPGQGSQYEGMLGELIKSDHIDTSELEEVLTTLNLNSEDVDNKSALLHTGNVQLALLLAGVMTAKHLIKLGIQPDFVAGNSIGAFGAAVIAESITLQDAAKLVMLRGQLMESAYPQGYGMLAAVGFSSSRLSNEVETFNQQKKEEDKIYLANFNTATQIIIAGPNKSLQEIAGILEQKGIRSAKFLKMTVPSHCILLNGVADTLTQAVDKITIQEPKIPYLSNIGGRLMKSIPGVRRDLGSNVAHAVLWFDGMQLLYEMGSRFFIEMVPSGVLFKIVKEQYQDAEAYGVNIQDWDTILYRYNQFHHLN